MIKPLRKLRIEGNFLNMAKGIYEKPRANIKPNNERLKAFPSDEEQNKQGHFHHCSSIWY
jgi:hypothetical protein